MGNQGKDKDQNRRSSNQPQAGGQSGDKQQGQNASGRQSPQQSGGQQSNKQQSGHEGNRRQQEQAGSRDPSSGQDEDRISQGSLDAGELGSTEGADKEERERNASARPRRNP